MMTHRNEGNDDMTHANLDHIASHTLRKLNELQSDLFTSAHVTRYNLNVIDNTHICEVALTIPKRLDLDFVQSIANIMNEINHNEDWENSFNVNGISFMIGDGDDDNASYILNHELIVWVRALNLDD